MWGFQAEGSAPIVRGRLLPILKLLPLQSALATLPRGSKQLPRDESGGLIDSVTDDEILSAYRLVAAKEGVFVEPSSAAGLAGLIKYHARGKTPHGQRSVITLTGHGLKDVQWALADAADPVVIPPIASVAAQALGLS